MTRRMHWLSIGMLGAALAVLFHRLLLGEAIFWGTPLLQFYPWREMAFDALRAGRLPLWNPLAGNGAPLLANYQTAVLYPPNWLYLLIPTAQAMGLVGLLHLLWAGVGMAAFLRRLGVEGPGPGVGALSYALSGYLVARFGFLSIISAAVWLPWLLWALEGLAGENAARDPRSVRRALALLAGVVALLLLAGHAQTAFYSLLLAGAYAVWQVISARRSGAAVRIGGLALALGGVMLGAALAAVQLAPTFELMQLSQRAGGVAREAALSYSFWPWHLLTFALPDLFGSPAAGNYWGYGAYWEDAVYVGLIPLALSGRALLRWLRGGERSTPAVQAVPFFALSLPPVLLLALGWNTPVFPWLFDHVPTFNLFNGPARWMLLAVFGLSVLGGIGAGGGPISPREAAWARRGGAAGLSLVIAALLVGLLPGSAIEPTFGRAVGRLGVLVMACAGLTLLLARRERGDGDPRRRLIREGLLLALLAADLVTAHWGLNPTIAAAYYRQRAALANQVPAGTRVLIRPADEYTAKFDLFLDFGDFRAADRAHWDSLRQSLLPNLGMLDGIPSASSFDPLQVGHHTELLAALDDRQDEALLQEAARLNAGLLLSPAPCPGEELPGRAGPLFACAVPDPWPRAALADCQPDGAGLICERRSGGAARITASEAERVTVQVAADAPGWLVLVDTDYPGWQAALDGAPADIRRANGAFRAVEVPAGEHEVVFTYRPASLRIGAWISAGGLIGLAALWAWPRRRADRVSR